MVTRARPRVAPSVPDSTSTVVATRDVLGAGTTVGAVGVSMIAIRAQAELKLQTSQQDPNLPKSAGASQYPSPPPPKNKQKGSLSL